MKKNFLIRVCLLLLILAVLITGLNYVTNPYNEKADRVVRGLYSDEAIFDDIDVALIGGSHACNGFNPHEIYKNYGLTAYNFSLSGEPIYVNYYHLKELYKTKKPALVVLDLYYLGMKNERFKMDNYVFDIVRCFRYNANRLQMTVSSVNGKQNMIRAFLPLYQYHSRWDELSKQDFLRKPDISNDWLLGSQYYFERNAGEEISFNEWNDTTESGGINQKNKEYLQKIIDLVKENGSKLLLVDIPHNHDDSGAPDEWVENTYMVMNEAKEIAEKNGVKYLQYDEEVMKEIGFVPEEDMYNKGHMNYWGSVKTSNYLGAYILKNYDMDLSTAHKEVWDEYLKVYEENTFS